ncbi:MAG: AMP-binding protein, partial [Pseudomonadota bacterium]
MSNSILETLRQEWHVGRTYHDTLPRLSKLRLNSSDTVADLLEQQAKKYPQNVAIYFEKQRITYREYDSAANRFANWARAQGLKRGDTVALLMHDRPEFLFAWLGMAKLGIVTALLNDNLHGHSLTHCLEVVDAKLLILDSTLADEWHAAETLLETPVPCWSYGGLVKGAKSLNAALSKQSEQL